MTGTAGATVAIVLYAVGVVMLFGVRSWQQKRATGSAGFNGFTADRAPAVRVAGLLFAAAVVSGLLSPALVLLGVLPVLSLGRVAGWFALVIALAGFGLAVLAQQTMGRSWRIGVDPKERTDLITHGVFGYVRNPIFTAMIAAQAGTTLLAPTWLAILGLALFVAGVELQVRRVEEPHLLVAHGVGYGEYSIRTGRFLPLIGRTPRRASALAASPSRP
jgi:protein-S-isoprenylcysteine O-methyltransferase Ste14